MNNVTHGSIESDRRQDLARQALRASIIVRANAQLDPHKPICIYSLCEILGIRVRFNDINMEGMYQRGTPPRIHLSARRPLARRAYSCAHELGHHVFGHGSSIHELRATATPHVWEDPNEFLADAFAGFALMPVIGLHRAFATRDWAPETATAAQVFMIACDFSVGYRTLLTHLATAVNMMPRAHARALQRITPKAVRAHLLGTPTSEPLLVADRHRAAPSMDAEVNTLVLLPAGTETTSTQLIHEHDVSTGRLFRAVRPGIAQVFAHDGDWSAFIRVAREGYVGLAEYRHLEDEFDE